MKRFSEQLQKKSATIRLSAIERADLRARVTAFMEYHPAIATAKVPVVRNVTNLPSFWVVEIKPIYWRSFAGVCALLLVIGVPSLAERAIPGDILYPIKVSVTEEIRGSLNLDPYQKVAWETTRLERRISEARLLAKAGKLTPAVEASVLEAVETQKVATESEIETLRTTDAEGASLAQLTYATMLGVQSSVLKADDSASTTAGMSTVALASALDASLVEANGKGDSGDVSLVRLQAQLELETTRSYELLKNISPIATKQEQKDIERRLSDLGSKIERGSRENFGDEVARKQELRAAWADVQKLISFMTDIDVRAALAIDTLVPVVPTETERIALVIQQIDTATMNQARIVAGLETIEDSGISEKITLTLPEVTTLLETASTTLYVDIGIAELAVKEALALTDSMVALGTFPAVSAITLPIATSTIPVISSSTTATSTDTVSTTTERTDTE